MWSSRAIAAAGAQRNVSNCAFFFASEVPGRPSVVRPLLSRLAADDASPIQREMRGFYAKAWSDGDASRVPLNRTEVTLLEGLRSFGYLECVAWREATEMLKRGGCQQRLGQGVALRGDLLMQVGSAERSHPKEYFQRLDDAMTALEAAVVP